MAAACVAVTVLSWLSLAELAARSLRSHSAALPIARQRTLPYPRLELPLEIDGSQYVPLVWADIPGWAQDDHVAAFKTFRQSCRPIAAQSEPAQDFRALGASLRDPCRAARAIEISDGAKARSFFEENFTPLKISRLGEGEGFVTGYYEPVIEGSRTQNEVYPVPLYRRPSNLFVRGYNQASPDLPNRGPVYRKIGRRKLVPYYDRAEIEDGAIEGRGLEICFLRNQTDLLFAQIQGSARIELDDGSTLRINYDSYNGYPYTPVGRVLIERGIIPREQMSMQKIRDWMDANPDAANDVRRQNRSYIFFREVELSDKDEAVGAQGIALTPGRSIAVDKSLHVYGTPFFIEGELPIESETSKTPFRRLMIAQDTGSAITGPARADLYFGAGADAGKVAGRLRQNVRFVILVPKSLDPQQRAHKMPLPDPRPSEKIAKLVPQTLPMKDSRENEKDAAPASASTVAPAQRTAGSVVAPVPLPEARPASSPSRDRRHHSHRGRQ